MVALLATVRFRRARRGIIPERASALLSQEGIGRQEIDLTQPVLHGKAQAMKSVHSVRVMTGLAATGLAANVHMVSDQANQQAFGAKRAALARRRSIQASV